MGKIIIDDLTLTFEQISKGDWPPLSPHFEEALHFCKEWLTGKENFDLQTSGSTGLPKTISIHRKQMEISANATRDFFNVPDEANLLGCLNTQMIGGKMMLVRAMEWNSCLYLVEPSSDPLVHFRSEKQFHFAAMVPLQLAASIENPDSCKKLSCIQNLIIGGAPLNVHLKDKAAQLPINIYQTFGMTETVSHIALAKIIAGEELIYQALPSVVLSLAEDDRLIISAPMAKEKTLLTTDIVQLLSSDSFKWLGRADFTINSGGIKAQPELIENQISQEVEKHFPGSRFFIFGEENENFGQLICLLVEQSAESHLQSGDILNDLKDKISKYTVPKKVYFLESFIKTASGKINRPATIKKLYT